MYNIEVDGDHVYRVGEQGLLVHNASVPCTGGVGYSNATWQTFTVVHMRRGSDTREPGNNVPLTRAVNIRLDNSTLGGGRSDASTLVKRLYYKDLSYFFDSRDSIQPNAAAPERARIGYRGDTAGHIVPSQFGGPGNDLRNFFAQSPASQRQYDDVWGQPGQLTQSNGEPTIFDRVKNGCDVWVRIVLTYPKGVSQFPFTETGTNRPYRPTLIHVSIWSNGTQEPGRRFTN